jgi:hypothetical protein
MKLAPVVDMALFTQSFVETRSGWSRTADLLGLIGHQQAVERIIASKPPQLASQAPYAIPGR